MAELLCWITLDYTSEPDKVTCICQSERGSVSKEVITSSGGYMTHAVTHICFPETVMTRRRTKIQPSEMCQLKIQL